MRRKTTRKGFSLTEVLIALIIIAILGGCAIAVMHVFIGSYNQVDDYTTADMELENAVQQLTREFALIGLGMPNNRQELGSFALLHRMADEAERPAMAYFGAPGSPWGGPVTISAPSGAGLAPDQVTPDSNDIYVGPELFYAWAVPTGVNVRPDQPGVQIGNGDEMTLGLIAGDDAVTKLQNMHWGTRAISFAAGTPTATSAWITMPTLRLPLLMKALNTIDKTLTVTAAPVANSEIGTMTVSRTVMSMDEIHIMQAARLHLANGRLVRSVLDKHLTAPVDENLTENVVALQFAYNPNERILSMFLALRGREPATPGAGEITYPPWMPDSAKLPATDPNLRFRIVSKTLFWRIRN